MLLNNSIILLVISYLDIHTLNRIKNVNLQFLQFFYSDLHMKLIKENYKLEEIDVKTKLLNILCVLDNKCFCCKKEINDNKVIVLNNLLYCSGKCILCFKMNCNCYLYPYFHYDCIKSFELPTSLYKIYRKFYIPFLSKDNKLDGIFVRER